jgi:selenocysteine lyase/cysteine desulfurase
MSRDQEQLPGRYREEFPILERKTYLNSNSLGALSGRSIAYRRQFEEQWNDLGASAWYELWMAKLEAVRAAFGRIVAAGPAEIALLPSVSAGLAAVAGSLDLRHRNRVVVTDLDFPTLCYQFLSRERTGLEVVMVESPDGIHVPLERIEAAVDDRTAMLATSHVFFSSGAIQDVAELSSIAHRHGALFLLDAYQSTGQIPVDMAAWEVDLLLSGSLKWLCGGPGLAFLYVRPEIDLQPTTLSWFGVEDQFSFDPRAAHPHPEARRFELGTPAVGAAFTAAGGLEIIEEVGIPEIHQRNRALSRDLVERLAAAGFRPHVATDPDQRSAVVLADHPDAAGAVEHLARSGIIIDYRKNRVRLSPHFYNTIEDNRLAVEALGAR